MAKIALHQGSYEARSPIANAQAAINVYPEPNPQDAPFPFTHYPAPGVSLLSDLSSTSSGVVRGLYTTSTGALIAVIGSDVLNIDPTFNDIIQLGAIGPVNGNPVSMCDNGATLVIVDGSANGWQVPIAELETTGSLTQIVDDAFYGSTRVDYIDTFMIFNAPGTGTFYTTTSGVVTPFDPTYAAAKEGWNDLLVCAICLHDNIWLLGNTTTEIWYNAGGTTFPFARMPNSILQQGCAAPYSAVVADNAVYWLSQDRWGHALMMRGEGYMAKRVSNFAVENIWHQYPTIADCIGMVYQIGGHEVVGFYFPTANAWWAYDASIQMWHQRMYANTTDAWLPRCTAYVGTVAGLPTQPPIMAAGSRNGGQILGIDSSVYTDLSQPIQRQRSWVHIQQDGQRLAHTRFSADMAGWQMTPDTIALDWSDDAGFTFGTPVPQTTDNQSNGQYQWRRLGYARDRVYRLTWSGGGECALNGAYVDIIPHGT